MGIPAQATTMTFYYMKSSGYIVKFCTGTQDMSFFGVLEADYSIIMDYVVVPFDNYMLDNKKLFKVNTTTKEVELKADTSTALNKYKKEIKVT
jgi:hypothetical protein